MTEMLNQGEQFVAEYRENVERLTAADLADIVEEHDA